MKSGSMEESSALAAFPLLRKQVSVKKRGGGVISWKLPKVEVNRTKTL